jgi:hypothetical protein
MTGGWRAPFRSALDACDRIARRVARRRTVLVYVRTAMHAGVLEPVSRVLGRDPRIDVRYVSEDDSGHAAIARAVGRRLPWMQRRSVRWLRIDLFISADPWAPPTLQRCGARLNFFHGVAGKYDLDDPSALPIGFDEYDRVAFINEDRMRRYLARRIVSPEAAVLVGFPKADPLVNGEYDGIRIRRALGLDASRRTAIYAPTWSPASSLHTAGERIIANLAASGWNVIVKPHARSFDPDPQYSGGIDWQSRLRSAERPGRVVLSTDADASPLLAASDLMVTDHSTIGFEFCLLDRPLIVFDAPGLAGLARINPERIALLRSAAHVVVRAPADIAAAATEAIRRPGARSAERRAVAASLFHRPGTATERALALVYEMLGLSRSWEAETAKTGSRQRPGVGNRARRDPSPPRPAIGS